MSDWQRVPEGENGWQWGNIKTGETIRPNLIGYDPQVFDLLDQASQKLGLANPDYKQLAQDIIQKDNINGGRGFTQGTNAVDVANNIIRAASFDPQYKSTFDAMPPEQKQQIQDAGYANGHGYYDPSGQVYQQGQQAGLGREQQFQNNQATASAANNSWGGGGLGGMLKTLATMAGGANAFSNLAGTTGAAASDAMQFGTPAGGQVGTGLGGGVASNDMASTLQDLISKTGSSLLNNPNNVQVAGDATGIGTVGGADSVFNGVGDVITGSPNSSVYDALDVANNTSYGAQGLGATTAGAAGTAGAGLTAGQIAGGAATATGGLSQLGGSNGQGGAVDDYGAPIGTNNTSGTFSGVTDPGGSGAALTLKDLINNPSLANFQKLLTGEGGGYKLPLSDIITGLQSYVQGGDKQTALADAAKQAQAASDPFASQRPFYQGELNKMFTDPNYFSNNQLLAGANANAVNDTSKALAARGYNMSGNEQMDIAQRLQNNNLNYANDLFKTTGGLAGGNLSQGNAGQVGLQGTTAALNQGTQNNGQLGNVIANLFKGAQTNTPNTTTGTTSSNIDLSKFLFG